ncbi:MAG: glycosyltransferase family 2 protein [Pseudomonadota bacterium]
MSSQKPNVSAVLITLNAAAHLSECLAGLKWCDEIVVLDGGSTDATEKICREFGARVHTELRWQGFGVQKNRAVALASSEWVFSVDADEICGPELRAEIERALADAGNTVAFEMPRSSSFCGHWMRHGGWWPDYVTRLFRRGSARFSDDVVHERLIVEGVTQRLQEPLLHYTYDTMAQALEKQDRYSTLGAQKAFEQGQRATPFSALTHGLWTFLRTYFLRLGLLDGRAGWMLANYNARTTYLRYLKLWRLGQTRR